MSEKQKRSKADAGKWFREMKSELKKIVWPTWAQVVKNTGVVIAMMLVIGIFIGIIDLGLTAGVTALGALK
jgi:preprotein translocase subunit SecE